MGLFKLVEEIVGEAKIVGNRANTRRIKSIGNAIRRITSDKRTHNEISQKYGGRGFILDLSEYTPSRDIGSESITSLYTPIEEAKLYLEVRSGATQLFVGATTEEGNKATLIKCLENEVGHEEFMNLEAERIKDAGGYTGAGDTLSLEDRFTFEVLTRYSYVEKSSWTKEGFEQGRPWFKPVSPHKIFNFGPKDVAKKILEYKGKDKQGVAAISPLTGKDILDNYRGAINSDEIYLFGEPEEPNVQGRTYITEIIPMQLDVEAFRA